MNKMKGICLQAHDAHSRNIIMYFIEIVFLWEMTEAWFWYQKKMLLLIPKENFVSQRKSNSEIVKRSLSTQGFSTKVI